MFERIAESGRHLRFAADSAYASGLSDLGTIRSVAILADRDAVIVANALEGVISAAAIVPVWFSAATSLPRFVDDTFVVVVISPDGDDPALNSVSRTALDRGAEVIALTSESSALAEIVGSDVVDVLSGEDPVDASPWIGAAVAILDRIGVIGPSQAAIEEAILCVSARIREFDPVAGGRNEALTIARTLDRRISLIYGAEGPSAAAAVSWKSAINRWAKAPAFSNSYPDLLNDEVAGWGQQGDVTRQIVGLVQLHDDAESKSVARARHIATDMIAEALGCTIDLATSADHPLAQFFDLSTVGNYVALYLAAIAEVDPGPVDTIDAIRSALETDE